MRITNFIVISFYTLACLLLGAILIYLSLGLTSFAEVLESMEAYYEASQLNRFLIGLAGALLIIISVGFVFHLLGGLIRRERTLVFSAAGDQIKVSLAAIEDVVRRCGDQFLDVKDIRPRVAVKRRGLDIQNKVTFYAGVNIPEITERLQSLIKERLGKVFGIEDDIKVRIHVTKVVEKGQKARKSEGSSRRMELGK